MGGEYHGPEDGALERVLFVRSVCRFPAGLCGVDSGVYRVGLLLVVAGSAVLLPGVNTEVDLMKTVKIGKHTAVVYDAIDEMPIERWHKFQRYALVDAGIGADIESLDRRLERVRRFVMAGKNDKAEVELSNLRQCVYLIQQEILPEMLAYAALVAELDGEACTDLSDEGLKRISERLKDAPKEDVSALFGAVKKKIDEELNLYYPKIFAGSEVKEFYDLMRARAVRVLRGIIEGSADPLKEAEAETTAVMTYFEPKAFSGDDAAEVVFDRQFATECALIAEQLHINARRCTVMEFYGAIDLLQARAREACKAQKQAK